MGLSISVVSQQDKILAELKSILEGVLEVEFVSAPEEAQIVFVDGTRSEIDQSLDKTLDAIDRRGRAVFLVVSEEAGIPPSLVSGKVDDVLVRPLRLLEVLSRIRQYEQVLLWAEVSQLNVSFSKALEQLTDDLGLAERLQKGRLPTRFPDVRGVKVTSRYIAGLRPGGDHFDLAEANDGAQIGIILTDSSSYGLSSAVLSVLVRVAMRLSGAEARSCVDTVRKIRHEMLSTLSERDRLSMFYGILSRKDLKFRYLNFGSTQAFYARPGEGFILLSSHGGPLTRSGVWADTTDTVVELDPEGRLAVFSDGYVEIAGGPLELEKLLNSFRDRDAKDILNEVAYRVKSKLPSRDELPEQDCSGLILELDSKILRLAR